MTTKVFLQGRPVCIGTRMRHRHILADELPEYIEVDGITAEGMVIHCTGSMTHDLLAKYFVLYETPNDIGICMMALGTVMVKFSIPLERIVPMLLNNENVLLSDAFGAPFCRAEISPQRARSILLYLFPQVQPELSNDECDHMWTRNGGKFHGPNVETGCMTQEKLRIFLRRLTPCDRKDLLINWSSEASLKHKY